MSDKLAQTRSHLRLVVTGGEGGEEKEPAAPREDRLRIDAGSRWDVWPYARPKFPLVRRVSARSEENELLDSGCWDPEISRIVDLLWAPEFAQVQAQSAYRGGRVALELAPVLHERIGWELRSRSYLRVVTDLPRPGMLSTAVLLRYIQNAQLRGRVLEQVLQVLEAVAWNGIGVHNQVQQYSLEERAAVARVIGKLTPDLPVALRLNYRSAVAQLLARLDEADHEWPRK